MSRAESIAEKNLRAECLAVEEGHHAFVVNGGAIEVVSDRTPTKRYQVTYRDSGYGVVFDCLPVHGPNLFTDDHQRTTSRDPGHAPCKHAALAARRLEREGLVVNVDGVWFAAPASPNARMRASEPAPAVSDDDLFAGFD